MQYIITYPDGSKHQLTKDEFIFIAKEFDKGKTNVLLTQRELLLSDKYTWAGQVSDDTYKDQRKMPFFGGCLMSEDLQFVFVDGVKKSFVGDKKDIVWKNKEQIKEEITNDTREITQY